METKLLMIGDWVLYDEEYYRVGELCYNDKVITLVQENKSSTTEAFASENLVTPIPLTAEILGKNGFELDEEASNDFGFECYAFPFGKGFYIEHHNEYMITDHQLIKFKYVHELQHILKLCKIDKEIKL